jgi:hypothetical protein
MCETCKCSPCNCDKHRKDEDPYQHARRRGENAKSRGGDWRDNPHTPGTREWFEFNDGLTSR